MCCWVSAPRCARLTCGCVRLSVPAWPGPTAHQDFYLLQEQDLPRADAEAAAAMHPPLPKGENMIPNFGYDTQDHREEHPSEKQHVFLSASSCFSFEAVPRFGKSE